LAIGLHAHKPLWARASLLRIARHPARFFTIASTALGLLLIAAAPPLRGPDETAHFLRAYGLGAGDIIPSMSDAQGRKGVLLPGRVFREFEVFDAWQRAHRGSDFSYRRVFEEYRATQRDTDSSSTPVFVPYGGSEGYSFVAYIPQALAAAVARAAGLGFVETFYLMRLAGLLFTTAVLAYAIRITPTLSWTFVAVAMLPSALYGRAVINADGPTLAFSIMTISLFLRTVAAGDTSPSRRAIWMVLCALAKPPNVAFAALEGLAHRHWKRGLLMFLAVSSPAVLAGLVWAGLSGADAGAWRLAEITGTQQEQYSPVWKLRYSLAHPEAFPAAILGWFAQIDVGEFGRQVVGVLGLFDTVLRPWIYYAIGLLLILSFAAPLRIEERGRCAVAALVTALGYSFAVLLIMYLVWTPLHADAVWGVQGRYFVPILPLVAIVLSAGLDRGIPDAFRAVAVVFLSLLSGLGALEAIMRMDWNL